MSPLVRERCIVRDVLMIPGQLDQNHPGAKIVAFLCHNRPPQSRATLRRVAGLNGREPRFAASFEWRLLRINDTLPRCGWRIAEDNEVYQLERVS